MVSRRVMYQLNMAAQAQAHAEIRVNTFAQPVTKADEDDVRAAAERFIVETEKDGPFAFARAKAIRLAAGRLQMLWQEAITDEIEQDVDLSWRAASERTAARLPGFFKSALAVYQTVLETVTVEQPETAWYLRIDHRNGASHSQWYCPSCYEQDRANGLMLEIPYGRDTAHMGPIELRRVSNPTAVADLEQAGWCHGCGTVAEGEVG